MEQFIPLISHISIFNLVILLISIASIAVAIAIAPWNRQQSPSNSNFLELKQHRDRDSLFRVIVPIANPNTERYLIEMGALIARHESGIVIPLSIAKAYVHMDDPRIDPEIENSRQLLDKALLVTEEFKIEARAIVRIDDDIVHGISRTAREQNASLIVMGWSNINPLRSRLFGSIIDSVFWAVHCPVAVMRLLEKPINIQQVLVPVKDLTTQSLRTIRFARLFAEANQAVITLLHICDRSATQQKIELFEKQLAESLEAIQIKTQTEIKILRHNDTAEAILTTAKDYDLVVLRSMRRRTAGGLAVSDISDPVIRQLKCSFILFGEPN